MTVGARMPDVNSTSPVRDAISLTGEAVTAYRVIAVPEAVAAAVRDTRVSPFAGHPAHDEIAQGYGPCRLCLRMFAVGADRRILFAYDPFAEIEKFPLPGPVFIHETVCARYPEDAGFPDGLLAHPLTLNAYGRGRRLRSQVYCKEGNPHTSIALLLKRSDVDYIHVRDTEAGCYDFRIERVAGT